MNPIIHELGKLIGFPTVSNRPVDALAGYVAERMESMGFEIERFRILFRRANTMSSPDPDQIQKADLSCLATWMWSQPRINRGRATHFR